MRIYLESDTPNQRWRRTANCSLFIVTKIIPRLLWRPSVSLLMTRKRMYEFANQSEGICELFCWHCCCVSGTAVSTAPCLVSSPQLLVLSPRLSSLSCLLVSAPCPWVTHMIKVSHALNIQHSKCWTIPCKISCTITVVISHTCTSTKRNLIRTSRDMILWP